MKKTPTSQIVYIVISAAMAILFAVWSYYQVNDQDSLPWVLVYGIASITSVLFIFDRLPAVLPAVFGIACLAWGAFISTQFTYEPPLILIEEWREMMGLFVIAIWMAALWWMCRSRMVEKVSA